MSMLKRMIEATIILEAEESHVYVPTSKGSICKKCETSYNTKLFHCPERPLTDTELKRVKEGKLNFLDGLWINTEEIVEPTTPIELLKYWNSHMKLLRTLDVIPIEAVRRTKGILRLGEFVTYN